MALAARFGFAPSEYPVSDGLFLYADAGGISLRRSGEKGCVQADFTSGAAQYRREKGGGELIAKAVGHPAAADIIDATGGLGRDAFVLAAHGINVRIIERHPAAACLLADGLARALACPDTAQAAARITLYHGDAAALLPALAAAHRPDTVYLDPMYPVRRKNAAVKKEMAYFHQLIGSAQASDDATLLAAARAAAKKRVAVKRPRLGEFLCGAKPAYQYSGKSTRFDIYLPEHPE
nr:class I SAM-dependent methyltransferase [Kingella potus]